MAVADHYTLIERQHRHSHGYEIEWELWGGIDLRDPRAGHVTGDLIEIYDDDDRDDARIHCKALNYDLTADLLAWLANPDGVATDGGGNGR